MTHRFEGERTLMRIFIGESDRCQDGAYRGKPLYEGLLSLFRENRGTCTTKHAVIATLARELDLPVYKNLGAYAMTEDLVAGTDLLLHEFALPYIPMLHCFLASGKFRVDLTEGNRNGKKLSIEVYLKVWPVEPHISAKEEYLLLREALTESILQRPELRGVDLKKILQAREAGIKLLKANLQ